jgi:hypothetical protein
MWHASSLPNSSGVASIGTDPPTHGAHGWRTGRRAAHSQAWHAFPDGARLHGTFYKFSKKYIGTAMAESGTQRIRPQNIFQNGRAPVRFRRTPCGARDFGARQVARLHGGSVLPSVEASLAAIMTPIPVRTQRHLRPLCVRGTPRSSRRTTLGRTVSTETSKLVSFNQHLR